MLMKQIRKAPLPVQAFNEMNDGVYNLTQSYIHNHVSQSNTIGNVDAEIKKIRKKISGSYEEMDTITINLCQNKKEVQHAIHSYQGIVYTTSSCKASLAQGGERMKHFKHFTKELEENIKKWLKIQEDTRNGLLKVSESLSTKKNDLNTTSEKVKDQIQTTEKKETTLSDIKKQLSKNRLALTQHNYEYNTQTKKSQEIKKSENSLASSHVDLKKVVDLQVSQINERKENIKALSQKKTEKLESIKKADNFHVSTKEGLRNFIKDRLSTLIKAEMENVDELKEAVAQLKKEYDENEKKKEKFTKKKEVKIAGLSSIDHQLKLLKKQVNDRKEENEKKKKLYDEMMQKNTESKNGKIENQKQSEVLEEKIRNSKVAHNKENQQYNENVKKQEQFIKEYNNTKAQLQKVVDEMTSIDNQLNSIHKQKEEFLGKVEDANKQNIDANTTSDLDSSTQEQITKAETEKKAIIEEMETLKKEEEEEIKEFIVKEKKIQEEQMMKDSNTRVKEVNISAQKHLEKVKLTIQQNPNDNFSSSSSSGTDTETSSEDEDDTMSPQLPLKESNKKPIIEKPDSDESSSSSSESESESEDPNLKMRDLSKGPPKKNPKKRKIGKISSSSDDSSADEAENGFVVDFHANKKRKLEGGKVEEEEFVNPGPPSKKKQEKPQEEQEEGFDLDDIFGEDEISDGSTFSETLTEKRKKKKKLHIISSPNSLFRTPKQTRENTPRRKGKTFKKKYGKKNKKQAKQKPEELDLSVFDF